MLIFWVFQKHYNFFKGRQDIFQIIHVIQFSDNNLERNYYLKENSKNDSYCNFVNEIFCLLMDCPTGLLVNLDNNEEKKEDVLQVFSNYAILLCCVLDNGYIYNAIFYY